MTQDLLPKFKFFQDIRIWPKNSDFDYEGWLENFSQDEHWTYYDDLYFPDQAVSFIWEQFVPHIRLGKLHGEDLETLEDGLALIEQTEAYQNYGVPSGIPFKNLIGNVIPIFRK